MGTVDPRSGTPDPIAGGEDGAGLAATRREERKIRELIACPLCGRSGGSRAEGREYCHRCEAYYDPTPLQLWAWATGWSLDDLPELTGLTKRTVMRAARGHRMAKATAAALERVTQMPARVFRDEARLG